MLQIDLSGAPIGRRYARTDQIGIPFAVTVDFQTLDPKHRFYGTVRDLVLFPQPHCRPAY